MAIPVEITKRHVDLALHGVWSQAREQRPSAALKRAAELLQSAKEELAKLPSPERVAEPAQGAP